MNNSIETKKLHSLCKGVIPGIAAAIGIAVSGYVPIPPEVTVGAVTLGLTALKNYIKHKLGIKFPF